VADRSALATRAVASRAAAKYERHRPEDTLLYRTVQAHWRTFLAEVSGGAEPELPRFVLEEVEAFLKCGILAHGFLRVVCDECHDNRLVAFSCKRRGFCGSCLGRRMCSPRTRRNKAAPEWERRCCPIGGQAGNSLYIVAGRMGFPQRMCRSAKKRRMCAAMTA
jgi:Transposase zinc-binding domain